MSKTLSRSLPALLLGLCMLIAQAVVFSQSSNNTAHAASTAVITVNGSTTSASVAGGGTLTIGGSGFTNNPGTKVTITFNAPAPSTSSATSSIAGVTGVPGDTPPTTAGTAAVANTVQVTVAAAGGSFSGASLTVPAGAVGGVYYVTASDNASALPPAGTLSNITSNAVAVTVTNATTQNLSISSSSGTTVPIGGSFIVTAASGSFAASTAVGFAFGDFTQGLGALTNASAFGATLTTLNIISCYSVSSATATAPTGNTCTSGTDGSVSALVQLSTAATALAGTTQTAINSLNVLDQVWSVVGLPSTKGASEYLATGFTGANGNANAVGIRVNHTAPSITVASNTVPTTGSTTLSGSGFGANANIAIYFVPSNPSQGSLLNSGAAGTPGYYFSSTTSTGTATPTSLRVATTTTNNFGTFSGVTVSIGNLLTALGSPTSLSGYFLAEDYANTSNAGYPVAFYPAPTGPSPAICVPGSVNTATSTCTAETLPTASGTRLNFPAVAAVNFLSGITSASTLSVTPSVAGVGSTVTVTGTFSPGESVQITLQSSKTNGAGTQCSPQGLQVLPANSVTGVVVASITVPSTCPNPAGGTLATSGTTFTVTATGLTSGTVLTGTFSVPALGVSIAAGTVTNTVVITGTGFGSGDPVIFQIALPNPFTGQPTILLSLVGTANSTGTAVVTGTLPASYQSGLYTLTGTDANNSALTASATISLPLVATGTGQLSCPTSVLAGQPFVISGTGLAPNASIQISLPLTVTGTIGTIFSNGTANLSQTFTAGSTSGTGTASATLSANATGAYSVTVALPLGTATNSAGYPLTVTAPVTAGGVAQIFSCSVVVTSTTPTLTSSLSSGTVGITTTLTGAGFGPGEPVNISLVYTGTTALSGVVVPGTTQTVVVSSTGGFTTTFPIASTVNALVPGTYLIQAVGQNTKVTASVPFIVTGAAGTTTTSIFFPEGYTGTVAGGANADFSEILSILNTNNFTTTWTINYFLENAGAASTEQTVSGTIGPNSVVERSVNTDVGAGKNVAAQLTSPAPLAATRVINRSIAGKLLDASSSEGQAVNLTATGPFTYYFASGEVQLTNEEYLTLLNPTATSTTATITILPQVSISATTAPTVAPITQVVPPMSRVTVPIRKDLVASGLTKFGMTVTSTASPLASERVEYYGDGIGSGKYGATTKPAGTTAFRQYIFASNVGTFPSAGGNNAIGTGTDLSEIDIINPGAASAGSATVTVSFFDKTGAPINSQQVQVDGGTRETIMVNDVVGTQGDVFSAVVTSDKSVYVEKPTFYGGDPNLGGTHAVAAPTGSPSGLTSAAYPYLDTTTASGIALSQTVFLYNPGASAITVNAVYVGGGTATTAKAYTVAPNSITTVNVNADTASLPKGPIGGMFQLVSTSTTVGQSFVSALTSSTTNFSWVIGDQGTNLIGQ